MASETEIKNNDLSSPPDDAPLARSGTNRNTLNSVTALARFEFEPGRGNDGTKIMMVEWQDDNKTRHKVGSWQVSWPGKKTTFAADDNPSDSTNRLYILLPPGATVPPSITISYRAPRENDEAADKARPTSKDGDDTLYMTVHPLPAIFTPELGATAKASGKKGVLHTVWAKKRLQVLAKEIRAESELNLEGIALEMAQAEKSWIEQNFGIATSKPQPAQGLKLDIGSANAGSLNQPLSPGIQSPGTPGGRRLTDKLKGLSLTTNSKDFSQGVNTPTRDTNPLSPEVGDMAVSSFSTFKGDRPAKASNAPVRRMVPISPPSTVSDEQAQSASASLAGIARGDNGMTTGSSNSIAGITGFAPIPTSFSSSTSSPQQQQQQQRQQNGDQDHETDDLFAIAMSPRSPDAPKSPFSMPGTGEDGAVSAGGAFSRIKGLQPQRTF